MRRNEILLIISLSVSLIVSLIVSVWIIVPDNGEYVRAKDFCLTQIATKYCKSIDMEFAELHFGRGIFYCKDDYRSLNRHSFSFHRGDHLKCEKEVAR